MAQTYRELVTVAGSWALDAYDRGWTPLPLSKTGKPKNGVVGCKGVMVKGWTTNDVTREDVEAYATRGTGLRMGPQRDGTIIAALDFDIPPADTAQRALELFEEFIGDRANAMLFRRGRKAKFCVLVRIDEETRTLRSPYYDRHDDEARLEVFASHNNQIGAQGVHSVFEKDDEPAVMYSWDGPDPAMVAPCDLPLVTKAEIETFVALLHDVMLADGWTKRDMYEGEGSEGAVAYDLPEAVEAIVAAMDGGDRIRMLEIIGEGTSPDRGIVRHLGPDRVGVWDRNTAIMHLPARFEVQLEKPEDNFARFKEKMLAVVGLERVQELTHEPSVAEVIRDMDRSTWDAMHGVDGESWEAMDNLVRNLQWRYVHFPTGSPGEQIADMFTGDGMGMTSFKALYLRYAMMLPTGEEYTTGPKAGEAKLKLVNPVDQFIASADTQVIRGYQFDPSTDARLVGGDRVVAPKLNLYEPPTRYEGEGTDPAWFETYLEYLLPGEYERDWVRNWIACKVQRPHTRGVALVLVTPAMGTGRNVLMKIVTQLLGERWCSAVNADVLTGTSGQSQYDDTMVDRLLITCDEIAMEGRTYDARMKSYERLKSVFDPYPQERTLNRKGKSVIKGMVYYSALLASNHPYDALPLPEGDRRFAVIECTRTPFKDTRPDIKAIVDRVLPLDGVPPDAAMIKGLWEYMLGLETDTNMFMTVPMTEARQTTISDGEGDVEETIKLFLNKLPDDQHCFWFEDIVRRGEEWLKDRPNVRNAFKNLARKKLRTGYCGWEYPDRSTRFVTPSGASENKKGVVHKISVKSSPAERGLYLAGGGGDRPKSV